MIVEFTAVAAVQQQLPVAGEGQGVRGVEITRWRLHPMRACIQRVRRARVTVAGEVCGQIGAGMVVLLGVAAGDTQSDAQFLAEKTAGLRIFEDDQEKMNLALADVGGAMLVVSQFTLLGDCRKGRRPSFTDAARPELAESLYEVFVEAIRRLGVQVATGRFRQHMEVELVNDGPVTLLLDTRSG